MKTKFLILCIAALATGGCKKEIRLEVKTIHETDNTAEWNISIDRPVFSSTEENVEKSCVKFNDEISGLVNGIKAAFMEQTKESVARLDSAGMKQAGPYELIIRDSVFLADDDYISVRMLTYEFTGGAHGMTNFYAVNYDVKNQKFLLKKDILDYSKSNEINALLKTHLKNPDNCFDQEPTIDNFSSLNLTRTSIDFTYAQYILGPYSCGYTTISIPMEKLKGMLAIR